MAFFQDPPRLGNQFDDDALVQEYVARRFPGREDVVEELRELGELGGGELFQAMHEDRLNEPVHTQWDPWGNRIDAIEVTPLWKRAELITVAHGLVASAYERTHGLWSRPYQFLKNYLVQPSLDVYSCPLAMTDGAARTLLDSGNQELIDRAIPHLTARDPAEFWTSGQWMTERTGGSDVGASETRAVRDGDTWRLYGTKWFTSATTSQMALTLARPEGNGPGGRGLALFYVEVRDADGQMRNIAVNRLKDKLGTRKVPTAELTLDGTPAIPVQGLDSGVRNITPMLNVTRTWNAMGAAWGMRRAAALVRDYAHRRRAFGAPLAEKPLHADTVAWLIAETEAAFHLAFRVAELLGSIETSEATGQDELLARVLTPIAKLTTGKQAVAVTSEALECFGGAGYVEDTGLPRLLADAQVLPIWEGTTNVLSLDLLRALGKEPEAYSALTHEAERCLGSVKDSRLAGCVEATRAALRSATEWAGPAMTDRDRLEGGARRFALTLGRAIQLALLSEHAQWVVDSGRDASRALAAARRFAASEIDQIRDISTTDAAALVR